MYKGLFIPWMVKSGIKKIPKFDFQCRGVTSIHVDLHKYGYSIKGASAIIFRNSEIRLNSIVSVST